MVWSGVRFRTLTLAAFAACLPPAARAGEAACWFEGGVVVVAAEVAGIAGDFILDTGTAASVLHDTAAEGAGIEGRETVGAVRLAGVTAPARAVGIAPLDVRTWNLPTPVAGVIGADVLRDFVVDLDFRPCRVRLSRPAEAPAFRVRERLQIAWDAGRPTTTAAVFDGRRAAKGAFVVATGLDVAVRLADDVATAPGAARPEEVYPEGVWRARLAGLSFAGRTTGPVAAGLARPEGAAAGAIGGEALAGLRLRFDFPAGRLSIGR